MNLSYFLNKIQVIISEDKVMISSDSKEETILIIKENRIIYFLDGFDDYYDAFPLEKNEIIKAIKKYQHDQIEKYLNSFNGFKGTIEKDDVILIDQTIKLSKSEFPELFDKYSPWFNGLILNKLLTDFLFPWLSKVSTLLLDVDRKHPDMYTWDVIFEKMTKTGPDWFSLGELEYFIISLKKDQLALWSMDFLERHNRLEFPEGLILKAYEIPKGFPEHIAHNLSVEFGKIKEQRPEFLSKLKVNEYPMKIFKDFSGRNLVLRPFHQQHMVDKQESIDYDLFNDILLNPDEVWNTKNGTNQFFYIKNKKCLIVNEQEIRSFLPGNSSVSLQTHLLHCRRNEKGELEFFEPKTHMSLSWSEGEPLMLDFWASQKVDNKDYEPPFPYSKPKK